jgi:hypothetical protein
VVTVSSPSPRPAFVPVLHAVVAFDAGIAVDD